MVRLLSRGMLAGTLLILAIFSPVSGQDDVLDGKLPASKQAMLIIDASPAEIFADPVIGSMLNPSSLLGLPPRLDAKTYGSLKKLSVIVGTPDLRSGSAEFVARIQVADKSMVPKIIKLMFVRDELVPRTEDGWTLLESRFGWPDVIRYRDDRIEIGTSLYTYTSARSLASPQLAETFESQDKEAQLRIAFDAQAVGTLMDSIMRMERTQEQAVYNMLKWGDVFNQHAILLYGSKMLGEIKTAGLSVNLKTDKIATLNIVPMSGQWEMVAARAKVLHDFLKFHLELPIKPLKEKGNPVAELLTKLAAGFEVSADQNSVRMTLDKPDGLSKDFLAIVEKMKASFADQDNANRFKMLALAAHNYHDTRKRFPFFVRKGEEDRSSFSKDLSWRVKVLPYCEHNREYDQMDLAKGWDDRKNQAVVPKCQDRFVMSNGALVCAITSDPPVITFGSVLDGSSNTLMLIENRNAAMTPWTKPLDVSPDDVVAMVKKLKKGDFLWVAMYDGSVWRLPGMEDGDYTEDDLRSLMNPRDGKIVRTDEILRSSEPKLFGDLERPRRGRFIDEGKRAVPAPERAIEFEKKEAKIEDR